MSPESLILPAALTRDPVEVVLVLRWRAGGPEERHVLPPRIGIFGTRAAVLAHASNSTTASLEGQQLHGGWRGSHVGAVGIEAVEPGYSSSQVMCSICIESPCDIPADIVAPSLIVASRRAKIRIPRALAWTLSDRPEYLTR
jgi:hypothetical protein